MCVNIPQCADVEHIEFGVGRLFKSCHENFFAHRNHMGMKIAFT